MRRLLCHFVLLTSLSVGAQTITYDTIRVSPDDKRNIHRYRSGQIKSADESSHQRDTGAPGNQTAAFDKSKLRFGADLGISFGSNYTNLGFGPQAGYQFNNYFMAGAGIKYYYSKSNTNSYKVKSNLLGADLFGYLYPLPFIALFVQPEINFIRSDFTYKETRETTTVKGTVPSVVVGAGFRLGRSHITMNYDLLQRTDSPHPDGFYLGVAAFF